MSPIPGVVNWAVLARAPEFGFHSYPAEETGPKVRVRSERFADHYSQARQFYISQTKVEQDHIAAAFTFELSKVENPAIRARMVSHLLNVDKGLAENVAKVIGLRELPKPAAAARPTRSDLEESPALSILRNSHESFEGRKVGALITDGVSMSPGKSIEECAGGRRSDARVHCPEGGRGRGQRRLLDWRSAEN